MMMMMMDDFGMRYQKSINSINNKKKKKKIEKRKKKNKNKIYPPEISVCVCVI